MPIAIPNLVKVKFITFKIDKKKSSPLNGKPLNIKTILSFTFEVNSATYLVHLKMLPEYFVLYFYTNQIDEK